jgi:SAM-dependent methyltransferase
MSDENIEEYFATRIAADPRRKILWQTLCSKVFQSYVPQPGSVIELGAARGDFINNIKATRRIAVDVWPGVSEHVVDDVEVHVQSAVHLDFLEADSVDMVFASNFVEHLEVEDIREVLKEAKRVMRSGARLILVQPNYRTSYRRYFDDYTHVSIWTDVSIRDFLVSEGFTIERLEPRFLPLTIKSRLPVHSLMIRLYLASPIKPLAGQMLVVARRD